MTTGARLRPAVDAVLTVALDGLAADVGDDPARRLALLRLTAQQTIATVEREFRAMGSRDRARVVAEIALSAALLHHSLTELGDAPDLHALDLQALSVPQIAPRKD